MSDSLRDEMTAIADKTINDEVTKRCVMALAYGSNRKGVGFTDADLAAVVSWVRKMLILGSVAELVRNGLALIAVADDDEEDNFHFWAATPEEHAGIMLAGAGGKPPK